MYRVTCGNIGNDPESVEKFLETALHIGTGWGRVVLLDVFLEERTRTDLQPNALVSVFICVLEYYEVSSFSHQTMLEHFDKALKSRMQLALYYPSLEEPGRRHIYNLYRTFP